MLLSFLKKSSSAKFYWFAILLCVSASLSSEKCSAARYPCCETTAGSFSVTKLIGSLMMCKSTVWSLIFSKLNFHNPSLPILQFNTKKLKETSHSLSIFFFLAVILLSSPQIHQVLISAFTDMLQREHNRRVMEIG